MRHELISCRNILIIECIESQYLEIVLSAHDDYRNGFIEGFKAVKGDNVMLPSTPMMPGMSLGETPFREGIKAGIIAAGGLKELSPR